MISKKNILRCKILIFNKFEGVTKSDVDTLFLAMYGKLPRYCLNPIRSISAVMRGNGSTETLKGQCEYADKGFPYNRVIRYIGDSIYLTMFYTMGGKTNLMSPKENQNLADFIDESRFNEDLKDVLFVMFMLGVVDRYSVVEYLMDIIEFSDRLVFKDEMKGDYDRTKIPVGYNEKLMLYIMTFCCAIRNYEDLDFDGDSPLDMIDVLYDIWNRERNRFLWNELLKVFGFKWDYYPMDGVHFDTKYYNFIRWIFENANVSAWVKREVLLNSFDRVSINSISRSTLRGVNAIGTIKIEKK